MDQYDPKNIDKALKRMEKMDTLKDIPRSTSNIMSFFDENDKEHELQKQKSAAELKKEEYLQSITILKNILKKKGTPSELTRAISFGFLIETTNFFTLTDEKKTTIKFNMKWCNKVYTKYLDSRE
tara:strand:+ start:1037 stop:1411 length:375 start_codon:yes stop_codon:yes gene_type:complete